jgi:hypothetical protein
MNSKAKSTSENSGLRVGQPVGLPLLINRLGNLTF